MDLCNLILYDDNPNDFQTNHLIGHFSGLMCNGCTPEMDAKTL